MESKIDAAREGVVVWDTAGDGRRRLVAQRKVAEKIRT
jgi:hypothetical protein